MTRTAEELMTHHINSMMSMKKDSNLDEALSDYSEELVAITRLDGRTRTMGHDTLTSVMRTSLSFAVKLGMDIENAVEKLNFLYRQSTENYITLVASMPPFFFVRFFHIHGRKRKSGLCERLCQNSGQYAVPGRESASVPKQCGGDGGNGQAFCQSERA